MNSRHLNLVLLTLNLGLLAVVVYLVTRNTREDQSTAMGGESGLQSVTNTVTQIAVRKVNATNLLAALAGRPLSWRALESTNYYIYVQNLRNFGCPEETIRDIIITDVAKLYAKRRSELRAQAPPRQFWLTHDPLNGAPAEPLELQEQLAALEREQADLVKDLLGVDFHAELARYSGEEAHEQLVTSFLPEEKRSAVESITSRFAAMEQEVYASANGLLLDEDQEKLRQIHRQREAELAGILSKDELLQYQLYNSETANNLRVELGGFNPSQEEFVKIFQLQKSFDDQFDQSFSLSDDDSVAVKAAAQQAAQLALETELRNVLGDQRYSEYQRALDGDYKTLLQLSDRYQLGRDVANRVYDMKVASERQKQQIESTPNLTDQERAQLLASVAQQTERSVAAALGNNLYQNYSRSFGQWLNDLYFFDEANLPPAPPEPPPTTPPLPPIPPGLINSLPPGYRELLLNQPGVVPPPPPAPPR